VKNKKFTFSKKGDYIDLTAEMDMIVGAAAYAAGVCNNLKWTPRLYHQPRLFSAFLGESTPVQPQVTLAVGR